jgi:hypothetical protein
MRKGAKYLVYMHFYIPNKSLLHPLNEKSTNFYFNIDS